MQAEGRTLRLFFCTVMQHSECQPVRECTATWLLEIVNPTLWVCHLVEFGQWVNPCGCAI